MATAWEVLTGNSSLPDNGVNTAWDHLNNQQGGGGPGGQPYPVYITEMRAFAVNETLATAESLSTALSDDTVVAEADSTVVAYSDDDTDTET